MMEGFGFGATPDTIRRRRLRRPAVQMGSTGDLHSLQRRHRLPAGPQLPSHRRVPQRGLGREQSRLQTRSTMRHRRAAATRPRPLPPRARVRVRSNSRVRIASRATSQQQVPSSDNCYAYCLANNIDSQGLQDWWTRSLCERAAQWEDELTDDATSDQTGACEEEGFHNHDLQLVQLSKDKNITLLKVGRKDCFVFGFGCLVCWGCSPAEARVAKLALQPFLVAGLTTDAKDEDSISLDDHEGRPAELCFSSREAPMFERLALAYAMAQSVRLGSLELRIERSIAQTKHIPQGLAAAGRVALRNRELTRMMGELFVLRSEVNLETDILDTPEIFWDYDDCEQLYLTWRSYLDLDSRVSILNQRFEVVQDVFDVIEGELSARQGVWLEWVIILIIALDVSFMIFRLSFDLNEGTEKQEEPSDTSAASGSSRGRLLAALRVLGLFQRARHRLIISPVRRLLTWMMKGCV